MAAAACLRTALARSDEASHWTVCETPDVQDAASDARLLERIVDIAPDAVAATCYLWNVERTLSMLRHLKRRLPGLRTVTRFRHIRVSYEDAGFVPRTRAFSGELAQIIQHEVDHCDGVLV